jgi:hypothetical protein
MPPNNCDPALTPADAALGDQQCPKCGVEMEPIEVGVEGLPLQHLQLCPGCYLVMWSDQDGLHVRQGVPMSGPLGATAEDGGGSPATPVAPGRFVGEPTEC